MGPAPSSDGGKSSSVKDIVVVGNDGLRVNNDRGQSLKLPLGVEFGPPEVSYDASPDEFREGVICKIWCKQFKICQTCSGVSSGKKVSAKKSCFSGVDVNEVEGGGKLIINVYNVGVFVDDALVHPSRTTAPCF